MTLTVAWVRSHRNWDELMVASDSRLRAGYAWDAAPKILSLPRGDAVVAFAGSTNLAYPMMLQAWNTVASWDKAANRGQPLEQLRKHILRVFNLMLEQMSDLPRLEQLTTPDALFVMAGFSWRSRRYVIWTLHFDPSISAFTFRPARRWRGVSDRRMLALVGDDVDDAKRRLIALLRTRRRLSTGDFNYEPLEVLADMIADPSLPTIGGPPQLVQIQRALKVVHMAVPWPVGNAPGTTLMGRPLLNYEDPDRIPMFEWDRCLRYVE